MLYSCKSELCGRYSDIIYVDTYTNSTTEMKLSLFKKEKEKLPYVYMKWILTVVMTLHLHFQTSSRWYSLV